jgi:hypothetical protein
MARDGERLAGPGQRRRGVVHRTRAQEGLVAPRIEAVSLLSLLHQPVHTDRRDLEAAHWVAGVEPPAVRSGEPADGLLRREAVVAGIVCRDGHEGRRLAGVRLVQATLLQLGVAGGPERICEDQSAGDQEQVAQAAREAPLGRRAHGAARITIRLHGRIVPLRPSGTNVLDSRSFEEDAAGRACACGRALTCAIC